MRRPEISGLYQLVGSVGILYVSSRKMLETSEVMERVVADLMAGSHYLIIQFRIFPYIVAHHEERGMRSIFGERLKDERR